MQMAILGFTSSNYTLEEEEKKKTNSNCEPISQIQIRSLNNVSSLAFDFQLLLFL